MPLLLANEIPFIRFCLQRNTDLEAKEILKVFTPSDRFAVKNSQFSWRDERDMSTHERFWLASYLIDVKTR